MTELRNPEIAAPLQQIGLIVLLTFLIVVLFGFRFTLRTDEDKEQARAQILLQTLYELEQAYHRENGTYLPVDRGKNGDLLQLTDVPQSLRFRVEATDETFVAFVDADSDGDGIFETWRVGSSHPEPEQVMNPTTSGMPAPTGSPP